MNRTKRVAVAAVALLVAAGPVAADTYVKEENGHDAYLMGIRTEQVVDSVSELWIGEDRIAYLTPGRTFLVDTAAGTFCVVNTETRTYVLMPLPVILSEVIAPDLAERYARQRWSGTARPTARTVEILGRTAKLHELVFWSVEGDTPSGAQEIRVWATTEVDFDWERLDDLMVPMRTVLNRDEALREQLLRVRGAQLRVEWDERGFARKTRHFTEVVEIAEREAPEGVYAPPPGFIRKDRLTTDDF